jgi:hypothetical protein
MGARIEIRDDVGDVLADRRPDAVPGHCDMAARPLIG